MKKTLICLITLTCLATLAQDVIDSNTPPVIQPVPAVTVVTQTNVVQRVQPITLTADQMDALITAIHAVGIESNVSISSTNLQSVNIYARRSNGVTEFTVSIGLKR